ncbi:unnamed protein product [Oncorhynchus mykiss]|uniref:Mitochondrial 2-oxoglutarate/malate carrier protein n=1 Tax=Oncorhynchus mykiss TaxID=8022 RepID=A0A060YUA3_ONCMY|nr:unnamed protein product [Oncorhynchus mykiss]
MAEASKPKTSPKAIKFLFGGLAGMGATVFVQPLDLVKNRMQLSGQGGKAREYKTSFHALASILKNEGLGGIYTGLVLLCYYILLTILLLCYYIQLLYHYCTTNTTYHTVTMLLYTTTIPLLYY